MLRLLSETEVAADATRPVREDHPPDGMKRRATPGRPRRRALGRLAHDGRGLENPFCGLRRDLARALDRGAGLAVDAREVAPTPRTGELVGVPGEHVDERGADLRVTPEAEHDDRPLPAGPRQPLLERPRAGVEDAPVDVENRHLAARKGRRKRAFLESAVVATHELDDSYVSGRLVQIDQRGEDDADADCGLDGKEERCGERGCR
jgi:hypothetical protein